jgi:peptide/nickel transport system substrate-binding protein
VIGSGPFRFNAKERLVGARVVYDRNPEYRPRESGTVSWAAGPKRVHFERVEWQVMPDPGTAAAALQNGEVDWWENPINDLLPTLQGNPQIVTQLAGRLGNLGTAVMNHLHPPFDKPAVRRVILEALTQEDFMAAAAGDDEKLRRTGVGIFTPGTSMASDAGLDVLTRKRDLERAKKDLIAAGYKGERIVLMSASDNPVLGALGEVMHDLLQRLGMNVQYVVSDWGTLVTRRASKAPPDQGGWNIFSTTWTGLDMTNPVGEQVLRCGGQKGFFGWPDIPEIETLREAWIEAPDEAGRQRIARDLQAASMVQVPYLPLGQYFYRTAYRREIRDIVQDQFVFWNARREA